jgi:acyl-coenzyme A thioesterase PaaI-like protein
MTADKAPSLNLPEGCRPIDPFPAIRPQRSFVSDNPDGDRIRLAYYRCGDEPILRAKAWFGTGAQGPPGQAHGGAIASVLDEAAGATGWMLGYRVLVARLTVDFRKMVALGTDATIEASIVGVDGRKITCRVRMTDGNVLLAEAEALLVTLPDIDPGERAS